MSDLSQQSQAQPPPQISQDGRSIQLGFVDPEEYEIAPYNPRLPLTLSNCDRGEIIRNGKRVTTITAPCGLPLVIPEGAREVRVRIKATERWYTLRIT